MERKLRSSTLDEIKKAEGESEPLFKKIREDGAKRELPLIVATIREFADGRVTMKDKCLYSDGRKLNEPYDLSKQVDASLE